ncbi:hypothetical protein [Streptomyces sp. WMMB303]|uniref:hypothetical protein n=1 Tax=Streptomyces sp. WMMB303 TaxID=3034154 RepID=UPI0023EAB2B2|nr:hypothetical protein [Streptomyces sp. WMMB303]MDF4254622.1 hypothetical protein [Streptomyces sp. WMMB303]
MSPQAQAAAPAQAGLLPLPARLEAEAAATAELLASQRQPWRGLSGELVTAEQVVTHLADTLALLERVGWSETPHHSGPSPVDELSETSSVRQILRAAVWALKDFAGSGDQDGPMTFAYALHRAGDTDTWSATTTVLETALKARTGARYANPASWAQRRGRTLEDLRELAAVAAEAARRTGPREA